MYIYEKDKGDYKNSIATQHMHNMHMWQHMHMHN